MALPIYRPQAQDVKLNVLVYGDPGVGKTTFAATAQNHPAMRDVLFLNIEGGLLSVISRGDIQAVDIRSSEDIESVFWDLRREQIPGIKTVVIDSGSELQTAILEQIVRKGVEKAKGQGKDRSLDKIFLEDYGQCTAAMARILRWFRDLPINTIITALPNPIFPPGNRDENVAPIAMVPSFTAKLGKKVMGYMDMVWYMYTENGERMLLTQPHGIFAAKTRGAEFSKALPVVVKGAGLDLAAIYDLLQKKEASKTATNGKEGN